jgi:beta-glucosidase
MLTCIHWSSSDDPSVVQLWVDDKLVIDNWTRQRRGGEYFGCGTLEEKGTAQLVAHKAHSIYVEFCNVRGPANGDKDETVMNAVAGVRLGGAEVQDPEELLESAVELAKDADAVIAVVGLNADWYKYFQLY